jgi:hypothetical protein
MNETRIADHALAIHQALTQSGAAAEKQLTLIANNYGDAELTTVLARLTPAEIAALAQLGDQTTPSLVQLLQSPEQFLASFRLLGASWAELSADEDFDLENYQKILENFLLPPLLHHKAEDQQPEMLQSFLQHDQAADVLALLCLNRKDAYEIIAGQFHSAEQGTWQELYADLHQYRPELWQEIVALVTEAQEEGPKTYARWVLNALHQEAREQQDLSATTVEAAPEFLDL